MQSCLGLFLLFAGCVFAQTIESPEVARAKASIDRLRTLVEAGAAPRAQLEAAEELIADAEDAALLRKTLYGLELTDLECDDMIAAANRRLERRQQALDRARKLVDAGVASELSLGPFRDDLDGAQKELDLAHSRSRLILALAEMARLEETLQSQLANQPSDAAKIAERFDGNGIFSAASLSRVEAAYEKEFGKPLPVSARGETPIHRSLGFDHRGRVDVAIFPDAPEGIWLREFLTRNRIPYFAFRQAVPGKATGAHIHIGPMSTRFKLGG